MNARHVIALSDRFYEFQVELGRALRANDPERAKTTRTEMIAINQAIARIARGVIGEEQS